MPRKWDLSLYGLETTSHRKTWPVSLNKESFLPLNGITITVPKNPSYGTFAFDLAP